MSHFPARDEELRGLLHLSQNEIAKAMGIDRHFVRTRLDALRLKTDHAKRKARRAELKAVEAPSDADLVALYLAANKVTQLPSGYACGLSRWEGALWTAGANSSTGSWKVQQVQRNKNAGTAK